MVRTKRIGSAVFTLLMLTVVMVVMGQERRAEAQLVDFRWNPAPTPLRAVIPEVLNPDQSPVLTTIELTRGVPGGRGRADLTLGPQVVKGLSCPPESLGCLATAIGGWPTMAEVTYAPSLAVNSDGQWFVWGQDARSLPSFRGGLMHLDPETGEACPVCTMPAEWGAYSSDITFSRGPREVSVYGGGFITLPPDVVWALDLSPLTSRTTGQYGLVRYVEPASGNAYDTTGTWFSDFGVRAHAITAGEGSTVYLLYTHISAVTDPVTVNPTLAVLDEHNVASPVVALERADGEHFGSVSALLFRPSQIAGQADLLVAVNRSFRPNGSSWVWRRPTIYRVPLARDADGVLVPANAVVPREETYDLYVPELSGLDLSEVPVPLALAQREGVRDSLASFIEEFIDLESFLQVFSCDRLPLPEPCIRPELIFALRELRSAFQIGNYMSARDKAIGIGQRVNGCKSQGQPDSDDWVQDCGVQKGVFNKAGQAFAVAEMQLSR